LAPSEVAAGVCANATVTSNAEPAKPPITDFVSIWFLLDLVRRKLTDPSAVPADKGFSNCAMPMTEKFRGTIQSSLNLQQRISRTDVSIAAGCGATADRSDRVGNHPSRSGKDDWSAGARGLSWDQVW
jgi:hypothetical protein